MPSKPVLLASLPFGPLWMPSLGLGLLQGALEARGLGCEVRHYTLDYAARIGPGTYSGLVDGYGVVQDLVCEWVFARALHGEPPHPPEAFFAEIVEGGDPAHRKDARTRAREPEAFKALLLRLQEDAPAFADQCAEEILAAEPRVVGFTTVFEQTAASLAVARRIKARNPEILIVLGGANCEGAMGEALFEAFPFVDLVVSGEAEARFAEAMEEFLASGRIRRRAGFALRPWLEADLAEAELMVKDLDALPVPDFSAFFARKAALGLEALPSSVPFETSRGCWWGEKQHCTFCGLNGGTMAFRSKSPARALEEFHGIVDRYPGREVFVVDNILDLDYFNNFLPALASEGNRTGLFFETKANLSKAQLRLLKAAGVTRLQPGIESLSDGVLRLMRKGIRGVQNLQLLRWCGEIGLQVSWNWLYGFPGEDPSEYPQLAELLPQLHHLLAPGAWGRIRLDRFSPNFNEAEARGLRNLRANPAYRHVFGLEPAMLDRLAYYFAFDYADGRDVEAEAAPLVHALERWRGSAGRESLLALDKGDHLLVFDSRAAAAGPFWLLEGLERWLLLACDGVIAPSRLEAQFREAWPGTPLDEMKRALDSLRERRLLFHDGSFYLALPLQARPPADSERKVS